MVNRYRQLAKTSNTIQNKYISAQINFLINSCTSYYILYQKHHYISNIVKQVEKFKNPSLSNLANDGMNYNIIHKYTLSKLLNLVPRNDDRRSSTFLKESIYSLNNKNNIEDFISYSPLCYTLKTFKKNNINTSQINKLKKIYYVSIKKYSENLDIIKKTYPKKQLFTDSELINLDKTLECYNEFNKFLHYLENTNEDILKNKAITCFFNDNFLSVLNKLSKEEHGFLGYYIFVYTRCFVTKKNRTPKSDAKETCIEDNFKQIKDDLNKNFEFQFFSLQSNLNSLYSYDYMIDYIKKIDKYITSLDKLAIIKKFFDDFNNKKTC